MKCVKMNFLILTLTSMMAAIIGLTSCSLIFNNTMTEGTASDVVDSDAKADADVSVPVTIPIKPL